MSNKKINVLYLDDEEHNLTSFKAAYRREYNIFTTTSANEAVQVLSENEIHVVISDQKMPNLSGVEFFELIIPDFPDPVRILLTGYADIEAVIDAINKGQVYRYVAKPWNETDLKITIQNAFELYNNRIQLKQQNVEIQKAYNELEKFVYSASHDLRAPLVSILGVLKLARTENIEGKPAEYFGMIERTVNQLDGFVQNIISYYQNLKKGEILASIDCALFLDEITQHFEFFEGADNIRFNKMVQQDGELNLDEMRLKMILNNLLSNAIKYRDETKSDSSVDISMQSDANSLKLVVKDNGIGMNREDRMKAFEMFFRASERCTGSGIGLFIVKEAVDKMGGEISVSSELGQGAEFEVVIPNKR
ncbi:MAG: hybrid sensor histidine kinase/response regulator [Flavobacteriales bacterium]|nr:hybrid sensor histidine kinase/response regulator [Flavobacteriales bacterium]MDG2245216.1 hybrid sensor histidine kinase/response regulator [Flavobacteriales bacterium]